MSAPERVRLLMHGVAVEIACDDAQVAELVARRLAAFPALQRPPEIRIAIGEEAEIEGERPGDARVVHESGSGVVTYSDGVDIVWIDYLGGSARCAAASGEGRIAYDRRRDGWQWTVTRPLLTLTLMELLKRHSLFPVHAAAACRGGAAVLFAAESGSGKSTAALTLLLAGWQLLGDDLLFLREEGPSLYALGFPDEIDASPETIARFPQLGPAGRWPSLAGYPKRQLQPQRLRHDAVTLKAAPRLVLVPHVVDQAGNALEPIGPDELLRELLPNVLLTEPALAQRQLDLLARLARSATAFRLAFGRDLGGLGTLVGEALAQAEHG